MEKTQTHSLISRMGFGELPNGQATEMVCLRNEKGTEVRISNYGLTIVNFLVNDKSGDQRDIILGCDTITDYYHQQAYLSCIIGRYGNRIANGSFEINGEHFQLPLSLPPHTLHGGTKGFHSRIWRIKKAELINRIPTAIFELQSPDGDEGWPGNLTSEVTVSLDNENNLKWDMQAVCDKDCHINMTHHAYFNLTGNSADTLESHEFKLHSNRITEVDEEAIPSGEIVDVSHSGLDFTEFKSVQSAYNSNDSRVKMASGVDHCFVFETENTGLLKLMAEAKEQSSGLHLKTYSTQPGVQFYTGQFMSGTPARGGTEYGTNGGFCFEPQHFANSPNQSNFPSTLIPAGQTYNQTIIYSVETTE